MNPSGVQLRRCAIHGALITATAQHSSIIYCQLQHTQLP